MLLIEPPLSIGRTSPVGLPQAEDCSSRERDHINQATSFPRGGGQGRGTSRGRGGGRGGGAGRGNSHHGGHSGHGRSQMGRGQSDSYGNFSPGRRDDRGERGNPRGQGRGNDGSPNPPPPSRKVRLTPYLINIVSNYLRFTSTPQVLYAYTIRFWGKDSSGNEVDFDRRRELEEVYEIVKSEIEAYTSGLSCATDCRALWASRQLPDDEWNSRDYEYRGVQDGLRATIKFNCKLDATDTVRTQEYATALNAIITAPMRQNQQLKPIGANKFFDREKFNLQYLDALKGYFISARPGPNHQPILNINTATTAIIPSGNLLHILETRFQGLTTREKARILSGATIRITYDRKKRSNDKDPNTERNRQKIFKQFGEVPAKQEFYTEFEAVRGKKMGISPNAQAKTVASFLREEHGIECSSAKENLCVNVGQRVSVKDLGKPDRESLKGAIWIPAEFLDVVDFQPMKATLNSADTTEMIKTAVKTPHKNQSDIEHAIDNTLRLVGNHQPLPMGVRLDRSLIRFPARILPPPAVYYQDSTRSNSLVQASQQIPASWTAIGKFASKGSLSNLHITSYGYKVHSDPSSFQTKIENFGTKMREILQNAGYDQTLSVSNDTSSSDLRETSKNKECTIVILNPNSDRDDNYAMIKRYYDLECGQPSVCTLEKDILSKAKNLCLKVNMKMGGDNHYLDESQLKLLLHKGGNNFDRTIILGADVTHPGAAAPPGSPSIACVVGSVDSKFMNYPGSMRLQAGRVERIVEIKEMVKERLKAFCKKNGRYPTQMIFYRDGISESQFQHCKDTEVQQVKNVHLEFFRSYKKTTRNDMMVNDSKLKLTFLVAGKRHHTRFYPDDPVHSTAEAKENPSNHITSNGNCYPGLLVDGVVTAPGDRNFFLQSHDAVKGTARSAHYTVLAEPENRWAGDDLANLTHHLCFAFARATKGVSYASPAYIADKLCERGRVYLRQWMHEGDGFLYHDDTQTNDVKGDPTGKWAVSKQVDEVSETEVKGTTENEHDEGKEKTSVKEDANNGGDADITGKGKANEDAYDEEKGKSKTLKPTEEEVLEWKTNCALELSRNKAVWGHFDDSDPDLAKRRYNPWHPNLDDTMFWM